MDLDRFFYVFDLIGTLVFATSGALTAVKKKLDLYGLFVLALVTALGGGLIRDALLGRTPPMVFTDILYVSATLLGSLLVVLFHQSFRHLITPLRVMDAVGLGIFTVIGAKISLSMDASWFAAIMMGIVSGTGGGMIRDVLSGEVPLVLQREIYAVASLLGAALYVALAYLAIIPDSVSALVSASVIAIVRMVAVLKNWHLPKIPGN